MDLTDTEEIQKFISLTQFLEKYPEISVLNAEDNHRILDTLKISPMRLPNLELYYERNPDFNALLSLQNRNFITFVGKTSENEIIGFFSITWGLKKVGTSFKNVSYIGDFRILQPRLASTLWRKFYSEFLQYQRQIDSFKIDYHLSAILDSNEVAQKNLVARGQKYGFHYHPIKQLKMINILCRKPFSPLVSAFQKFYKKIKETLFLDSKSPENKNFSSLTILQPSTELITENEVIAFLDQSYEQYNFAPDFKNGEWQHRKSRWPHWNFNNFIVIKNAQGRILACTLPWSPSACKKMRVQKIKPWMTFLFYLSPLLNIKPLKNNQNIETLYLTHLAFAPHLTKDERSHLISQILFYIYSQKKHKDYHMISFADQNDFNFQSSNLRNFIYQQTIVNCYLVDTKSLTPPPFFYDLKLYFEMSLV